MLSVLHIPPNPKHLAQGTQEWNGKRVLMFSVTNSTWTLLAIVPSSTVCVFGLCLFSTLILPVYVRVYVQSNSTFYIDSHVYVYRYKVCSSGCFIVFV